MSRIRVPRSGVGRPRTRPLVVLADRAYSSHAIATRTDKLAIAYQAALYLAAILIWARR